MNFIEFFRDLRQSQPALILAGFGFFALFLVLSAAALFDSQQILGINRWIKPLKFAVSIAVYIVTLAVYLHFLRGFESAAKRIGWGAIAVLSAEMVLIVMQAARGATSHFNVAAPFDGAVYAAMGVLIGVNTLLAVYVAFLYFRAEFDLPPAIVWGMRLGLIVFLLGSVQGGYMSAQTGHAVGAADGGAGLPLINWSLENGDLRVAHFVGVHAIQAIPLAALSFVAVGRRFARFRPTILTVAFALIYAAAFSLVFYQALLGRPLLGEEITVVRAVSAQSKGDF